MQTHAIYETKTTAKNGEHKKSHKRCCFEVTEENEIDRERMNIMENQKQCERKGKPN